MTTWPSVTCGSGKSVTYCRLSRLPCSRNTTAFMRFSDSYLTQPQKGRRDARELCAVDSDGEIQDRTAGEYGGKNHVARVFDLIATNALGRFAVASRKGF